MKICSKCKLPQDECEFTKNKASIDGFSYYCKTCRSKLSKAYHEKTYSLNIEKLRNRVRANNKRAIIESRTYVLKYLKSHPCCNCGEKDPIVLEFHHLKDKHMAIARMISAGCNVERLKKEIKKCQILCANCHRRVTAKQQNWYNYLNLN